MVSGKVSPPSIRIPHNLVSVNFFRHPMPVQINFTLEYLSTTTENRVVADTSQMVSQVIDTVQLVVAIPAGEIQNHFAGERVVEARNSW